MIKFLSIKQSLFIVLISSLFGICSNETLSAPGDVLFEDDFENGLSKWTISASAGDAGISSITSNSATNSLYTRWDTVSVTSNTIDTSSTTLIDVSFWVRRGSDSFSEDPDTGEDLIIEYLDNSSNWQNITTHSGSGTSGQIYNISRRLPISAIHVNFQLRIRQVTGTGPDWDYWHIDDVIISEAALSVFTCDSFENGLSNWGISSISGDAGINTDTSSTGNNSLFTRWGDVSVTSDPQDTSSFTSLKIKAWVRRGSDSFSENPDSNENLILSYLNNTNTWIILETFLGQGTQGEIFNREYTLSTQAFHPNFQLKFQQVAGSGSDWDYWHIDDVCIQPATTLAAHYTMDEANWGSVIDIENGLNGSAFNGANTTGGSCRYGQFDGVNDYIQIPHSNSLNGSSELTYVAFIRPDSWSGVDQIMAKSVHGGGSGRAQMGLFSENGVFKGRAETTSGRIEISTGLPTIAGSWYHVALVFNETSLKLYVDGVEQASTNFAATTLVQTTDPLNISKRVGTDAYYFHGLIDDVRVYTSALTVQEIDDLFNSLTPCSIGSLDHIEISHDGSALTCSEETLIIKACANASCTSVSTSDVDVTLSVTGSISSWSANPLTIPANSNAGITVNLTHRAAETVTLSSSSTPAASNALVCSPAGCSLEFFNSGFILTLADHNSCTTPNLIIQAVKLSDTGTSCAPAYTGNQSINFAYNYFNPTSGTVIPKINNISLDALPGTPQLRTINFNNNATATLPFQYNDAGKVAINVSDASSNGLTQATIQPVITPPQLIVEATNASSACLSNNANCSVFLAAGQPFEMKVSAACSDTTVTPNFITNGVSISVNTVAPILGNAVSLGVNNINFSAGSFISPADNGVHIEANQSISEVGVFTITATSQNYFGTNLPSGTSASIGRFTPDHFTLAPDLILEQCNTFTYGGYFDGINAGLSKNGQTFTMSGTITAQNLTNDTTKNYVGSFVKLINTNISVQPFNISNSINDAGRVNFSPTLSFTDGIGSYNDSGTDFQYESLRGSLNLRADITAIDSDNVTSGVINSNTFNIRNGRFVLAGTFGPETNDLEMKVFSEYYDGFTWAENTEDSCTSYINTDASFVASSYTDQLFSGDTFIFDPVSVQALTSGKSAVGNSLWFSEPGAGSYGTVKVEYDLTSQAWLKFDWDNDITLDNPSALLSFGYYRGSDRVIYWKEVRN